MTPSLNTIRPGKLPTSVFYGFPSSESGPAPPLLKITLWRLETFRRPPGDEGVGKTLQPLTELLNNLDLFRELWLRLLESIQAAIPKAELVDILMNSTSRFNAVP